MKTSRAIVWILVIALVLITRQPTSVLANTSTRIKITAGEQTINFESEDGDGAEVFSLGVKSDPSTLKKVEGYAVVHKEQFSHLRRKRQSTDRDLEYQKKCYKFMKSGVRFKELEPWLFNPANQHNLNPDELLRVAQQSVGKWEDAADGQVGDGKLIEVFGEGVSTGVELTADLDGPDGLNEMYFGEIDWRGAIAVTILWGYFSGPSEQRELVEWDQIYDQTDFRWSTTGDPKAMDFESVVTHELGHALGLADLYKSRCKGAVMYGVVGLGEINKRTLGIGDIVGVSSLYST